MDFVVVERLPRQEMQRLGPGIAEIESARGQLPRERAFRYVQGRGRRRDIHGAFGRCGRQHEAQATDQIRPPGRRDLEKRYQE